VLYLGDMDLKTVAKSFAKSQSCGCSVTKNAIGQEEITIQGDLIHDIPRLLQEHFPQTVSIGK
jgi:translation initiation factor 1 (eIF-1/SUI1)